MPDPLAGLRVLVTRPAHQAAGFQRMLEQAGAQAVLFPVIAVQPAPDLQAARDTLAQLHTYDTVVFISANAVGFGLALLDARQRQQLPRLILGAIGKKTAEALQQHGFSATLVPASGFTSEDFLALPATQRLAGRRILIVRGEGGREKLAETLQIRGAHVTYCNVYQRVRPEITPKQLKPHHKPQQLDIIAITSSEGLLNLLALLDNPDWIKSVPLLVGSQRMIKTARHAGFSQTIVIADDPSDQAMFTALSHWAQEVRDD